MKINEINRMIDNDIIPSVLDFTLQEKENIDWSKLSYNNHYNSFDFFANKFTNGWQSIPGFDLIIQDMANNSTSPLEEMNERLRLSDLDLKYKKSIELENEKTFEIEQNKAEWFSLETFDNIFKKISKIIWNQYKFT